MIAQPRAAGVVDRGRASASTMSLWAQAPGRCAAAEDPLARRGHATSPARRCCARASTPPDAVSGLTFFVDGRQVCALTHAAVRVRVGRRRRDRRAPGPRGRDAQGRRPHRPDGAHQVGRLRRARRRRRRAGHGHRHRRPRQVRPQHPAVGVPRVRGRPAAGDHPLRVRRRAARARRRHRHLRQHGAGDAEAEEGGEGVPRRRAAAGSGDAARLQRQHLHADAQGDRSGRAHQGGRSAGAVGIDGALRRASCAASRCSAGRPAARRWSCSPTARIRAATRRSTTSSAGCSRAT